MTLLNLPIHQIIVIRKMTNENMYEMHEWGCRPRNVKCRVCANLRKEEE